MKVITMTSSLQELNKCLRELYPQIKKARYHNGKKQTMLQTRLVRAFADDLVSDAEYDMYCTIDSLFRPEE